MHRYERNTLGRLRGFRYETFNPDDVLIRSNRIWWPRRLEFEGARSWKRDGHLPTGIGAPPLNFRILDRVVFPIRDREDDGATGLSLRRPSEVQEMLRDVARGVRKDDLVARLHFLLAPPDRDGQVVERYLPEMGARGRFFADGRDQKVVVCRVVCPVEAEAGGFVGIVERGDARRPRTGVLVVVGPVAVMGTPGVRGHSMAAGSDRAFENRARLPLDAQVDGGLCGWLTARVSSANTVPLGRKMATCFRPNTL